MLNKESIQVEGVHPSTWISSAIQTFSRIYHHIGIRLVILEGGDRHDGVLCKHTEWTGRAFDD